jgi:hypothetical protein
MYNNLTLFLTEENSVTRNIADLLHYVNVHIDSFLRVQVIKGYLLIT